MGTAMAIFGRSLAVARVASVILASLAAALPYLALRSVDVTRTRALVGTAFALASPWLLWLGASTVPESFTATATAAAVIALAARPSLPFAAVLACACLSRYEPWPVAAVVAIALVARERTRHTLLTAAIVAAGPLAWMLWNAHAHGSPVHFFHRVSTFKRAIGAGSTSTLEALAFYPKLLVTTRPEVIAATLAGLYALRDGTLRNRWRVPLFACVAQLAFLAIGNARDGAPAHHAERALVGILFVLALFAVDACASLMARVRWSVAAVAACMWLWSSHAFADPPGRSTAEDRRSQIARGTDLRARNVMQLTITPCAYEHFALLAAYGAPENATVQPKSELPTCTECPCLSTR